MDQITQDSVNFLPTRWGKGPEMSPKPKLTSRVAEERLAWQWFYLNGSTISPPPPDPVLLSRQTEVGVSLRGL